MDIKNGKDLLEFLKTLNEEQLKLPLLFDTEARKFDYHMAVIGSVFCEDQEGMGDLAHIWFHEEYSQR